MSTYTNSSGGARYDAEILKVALAVRAEDVCRHLLPGGHRRGNRWLCGNMDGEPGKSLSVVIAGPNVGVGSDFATNQAFGNLLELWRLSRGLTFPEAIREAGEWTGLPAEKTYTVSAAPKPKPIPAHYKLSGAEYIKMMGAADRLRNDWPLCERIADRRGWCPGLVHALAGDLQLGWYDGKLAFLYGGLDGCGGMKLRGKSKGKRLIYWAFGRPSDLWRGYRLISPRNIAFICEGETDCISVISAVRKLEIDGEVVALPSATGHKLILPERFTGKRVYIVRDSDDAGQNSADAIRRALGGVAQEIRTFNPGDFQ